MIDVEFNGGWANSLGYIFPTLSFLRYESQLFRLTKVSIEAKVSVNYAKDPPEKGALATSYVPDSGPGTVLYCIV